SDWNAAWGSGYAYLSVTSGDQHPSVTSDGAPVTVVRRWTSDRDATVRVSGEFRCGTNGDGVGVSGLVGGRPVLRDLPGGGNSVTKSFDFEQVVGPGTAIDFAVDPGPGGDISFDATQVTATIAAH